MFAFEARQLCKHYRAGTGAVVRALDGISLTVARGSFVTLAGPSGSGKTTLLALLGGLERPTGGQVFVQGRDLAGCSDVELARVRRRLGFVFQDFSLIARLPVWENITYPLIPHGVRRAERYRLAQSLLDRFGLGDKLVVSPSELSGGEQQRVAVARALAGGPEALLADEPTSNLDARAGESLLALFREIHAEGTTVVVASHDPRLVSLADQVYQLEAGRLQAGP